MIKRTTQHKHSSNSPPKQALKNSSFQRIKENVKHTDIQEFFFDLNKFWIHIFITNSKNKQECCMNPDPLNLTYLTFSQCSSSEKAILYIN